MPDSEPALIKVQVPDAYSAFEDAHGKPHKAGEICEVTPRVAAIYGLTAHKAAPAQPATAEDGEADDSGEDADAKTPPARTPPRRR